MRVKIPVIIEVRDEADVPKLLDTLRPSHLMHDALGVSTISILRSRVEVERWMPLDSEVPA